VEYLENLGVEVRRDMVVGQIFTVDELMANGYDAVFLGTGPSPDLHEHPGENLNGVYSANEYLTRSNLMKAYLFPNTILPSPWGRRWRSWGVETWPWTRPARPFA